MKFDKCMWQFLPGTLEIGVSVFHIFNKGFVVKCVYVDMIYLLCVYGDMIECRC